MDFLINTSPGLFGDMGGTVHGFHLQGHTPQRQFAGVAISTGDCLHANTQKIAHHAQSVATGAHSRIRIKVPVDCYFFNDVLSLSREKRYSISTSKLNPSIVWRAKRSRATLRWNALNPHCDYFNPPITSVRTRKLNTLLMMRRLSGSS